MSAYMFEHDKDQPVLELTRQQAELLLRNTRHGRLAFLADGQIEVFPVNYAFDGKKLYFRTAPGTKLLAAEAQAMVAFETDGILPDEAGRSSFGAISPPSPRKTLTTFTGWVLPPGSRPIRTSSSR